MTTLDFATYELSFVMRLNCCSPPPSQILSLALQVALVVLQATTAVVEDWE